MNKSDKSLHNISIAAIKRGTIRPYDFKWTRFYESNTDFFYAGLQLDLAGSELIICSTVIDADNYSILTTRRLITRQEGERNEGRIEGAAHRTYGDFKGYKEKMFTLGYIRLENGKELACFIETGKASMVMIQAVQALLRTKDMTDVQVNKVARIWNNRSEI